MSNIKFSVIMPCYNSKDYVKNAVDSVANQTYDNWELILVNDGSTDGTFDILNSYAASDSRIVVFSKENGGYATAVNAGLEKISGDYFMMMGSDDTLDVNLFDNLSNSIKQSECKALPDCISFKTHIILDGNTEEPESFSEISKQLYVTDISFKAFYDNYRDFAKIYTIRDTSKCFNVKLLGNVRYYGKTGVSADSAFSLTIAHKAHSFLCVPVVGYYWSLRSDSVSATCSETKLVEVISNWVRYFSSVESYDYSEITEPEVGYLSVPSHLIVELSTDYDNAVKYRSFIKENGKLLKKLSKKYPNAKLHRCLNFAVLSPTLFAVFYKIKRLFDK